MTSIHAHWYPKIKRTITTNRESAPEVTVQLWQQLATELVAIMGVTGFQSIYEKSRTVTGDAQLELLFPVALQRSDFLFSSVQKDFAAQERDAAADASVILFFTFLDILAAMIGERLTSSILRSAWGDDDASHIVLRTSKNE
jgi:hypothetical protein